MPIRLFLCRRTQQVAESATGVQPRPPPIARALLKMRGVGVLVLLLTTVVVVAVLGAHAVCGAHLKLEQHEAMVPNTLRALVTFSS